MSQHLQLQHTANGLHNLNISLGTTKKTVPNLRTMRQLRNAIKTEVSQLILRYAKHRHRALAHYGQLDVARAQSIQRIINRFAGYKEFDARLIKPKILGAKKDLFAILPPKQSRFASNQLKLVQDLMAFATEYHAADMAD